MPYPWERKKTWKIIKPSIFFYNTLIVLLTILMSGLKKSYELFSYVNIDN